MQNGPHINDVILAVNDVDAQNTTFDVLIEKFKWVPNVGDWCGLTSNTSQQVKHSSIANKSGGIPINQPNGRKRSNSHGNADDIGGPHLYMHLTTPDQDLVASYPVKLSRIEDVVCILVARPQFNNVNSTFQI